MTQAISLPDRPLTVKPPVTTMRALWILLLCLAGAAGLGAWVGLGIAPSLRTDYLIRDTAQPSNTGRVSDGRCRTKIVLTTCDVTLTIRPDGMTPVQRSAHYFFVDAHSGNYDVEVMYDPAHPEWVSTSLGLDMLWNRLACAAVLVFGALAALLGGLRYWMTNAALRGRLRKQLSGRRMRPVQAELLQADNGRWVVADEAGRRHSWNVPPKARPFFMPDGSRVLAVTPVDDVGLAEPMVFPLDEQLKWIDLTPAEREALNPA
ncbi:hypothetical protein [Teichococcus deserti]|uniref:hypothetical protein n=1 Tax=Teichococcus deserti TaxID=1817963 RepID=UPI00105510D3|nr:hypothetical protein [Pseudoroseomonas deserti]